MIVGNGLLAKTFRHYEFRNDICVYAQGVSNSLCTDLNEYNRDYSLLEEHLKKSTNAKLIYFSTCSILDTSPVTIQYVNHKVRLEQLIQNNCNNYLIVRLPQIAGNGGNKTNILNYIHDCIKNEKTFELWSKAKRNIIDVDDVFKIVNDIIEKDSHQNTIINVANDFNYSLFEIVNVLEEIIGKTALYKIVEQESNYHIPVINRCVTFDDQYLKNVLIKYYA